MIQQTRSDQEVPARLSAVESAVIQLGEQQQDALLTHQQLTCDHNSSKLCVTPLKWNSSQHPWEEVQHRLRGAFSSNLKGQIDQLQPELCQQLQDIKQITKVQVFQTLHNNLQWLNPKTWFEGLNWGIWVIRSEGCLLIIVVFRALKCICKLFSRDVCEGQVAGFIRIYYCVCQNKQKRGRCWGTSPLVSGTV